MSKQNLFGGFYGEGSWGKSFSEADAISVFFREQGDLRGSSLRQSHRFP